MPQDWRPDLYLRFREQRRRPFDDLVGLLPPQLNGHWVDLGCGHGATTRAAAERLGAETVLGVDTSEAMLEQALLETSDAADRFSWRLGDIDEVLDEEPPGAGWDLVLSNAALHWLPDHERLLPRVLGAVRPGGWIAVQMPYNHRRPSHALYEAVALEPEFARHFNGFDRAWPLLAVDRYRDLVAGQGFTHAVVELRTYRHALPDAAAIAAFTRSTTARPFVARLPDEATTAAYLARYTELVGEAYPPCDDSGTVLFDFSRLLLVARRPTG